MSRPPRSLRPVVRYLVETTEGYSHHAWGLKPFGGEAWADERWHYFGLKASQEHAGKVGGWVMKLTFEAKITPTNRRS